MCKIEENTTILHKMLFRGEESMKIEELKNFKHIPEEEFDRDSLVDISNIDIRCDLPPKERMEDVLEKMKNPFAFKIGKYVVKTTFEDETGCTIGDCVDALLIL